ncbi:MAG: FKBP-type peptidyl-prolyl cis-trans isomerase [Chitinophagales bacterium]|nr:FKBP-type peptidyl-prolyl cis-trans isomerase [Chitinophagales bacterium]MCZ2393755.1 FKBP-type peptidyl-prolyl cis-trans isomerase [Chitinophagales bacterium]
MKPIIYLITFCLLLISCKKSTNLYGIDCTDNNTKAPQEEIDFIKNYIDQRIANNDPDTLLKQAVQHPNGFYYIIEKPGDNERAETCSSVNVDYKGRFFNGNVFDSREGATFMLYQNIAGWQQGVRLIGRDGKIRLFLPPSLAYGDKASSDIPAKSYLYFEVTVNGF